MPIPTTDKFKISPAALLFSFTVVMCFAAYHCLKKEPVITQETVEVVKVFEIVKGENGCPFIECFDYKSFSMWYQRPEGCCHQMQLRVKYEDERQFDVLNKAADDIAKVFKHFHFGHEFNSGVLIIRLQEYISYDLDGKPKINPRKVIPRDYKYIKRICAAIDGAEDNLN